MVVILFEFFANKTDLEWSHAMTDIAIDKGLNFITTGHDKGVEPGMSALINGQLKYGYTAREFNHSHPWNSYPSGLDNKDKDIGFARGVSDWYTIKYPNRHQNNFNIYKDGKYTPYNKNSTKKDYGL